MCLARALLIVPAAEKVDVPSNSSAVDKKPPDPEPPVTRTFPEPSSVALCRVRGADMLPVVAKLDVPSNSSALVSPEELPPVMSTLPEPRSVAV